MDKQIYTFNGGQLCNNLYYVLQMFIRNGGLYNVEEQKIFNMLTELGCEEYITINKIPTIHINSYVQRINIDFTMYDIHKFIKTTIMNTSLFNNIGWCNDKNVAIHIRNTDYLDINKHGYHDCFNRENYIKKCFETIDNQFTTIDVFSDDIEYTKKMYDGLFHIRFNTVNYQDKDVAHHDLIKLSKYKNKILWNSTFSYWSGFISDILFNNDTNIFVPDQFSRYETALTHINPKWKIIS